MQGHQVLGCVARTAWGDPDLMGGLVANKGLQVGENTG